MFRFLPWTYSKKYLICSCSLFAFGKCAYWSISAAERLCWHHLISFYSPSNVKRYHSKLITLNITFYGMHSIDRDSKICVWHDASLKVLKNTCMYYPVGIRLVCGFIGEVTHSLDVHQNMATKIVTVKQVIFLFKKIRIVHTDIFSVKSPYLLSFASET